MARTVHVDDPADPRLADYVRLREVELRTRTETEHGVFIAEGEKVVRRAVDAGFSVRSFLMAARWMESLAATLQAAGDDVPCYLAPDPVVEAVTGFHVHRGALAALHRRPLPAVGDLLSGARRVVVLEDVNDHANVGAVFRAAAAFDVDTVLISPRCADPLYRRAVKVSMGAALLVPWTRMDNWYDGLAALRRAGLRLLALTPAAEAVPLAAASLDGPVALLLGAEGEGLSRRWLAEADQHVRIPMSRGVDSLNVGAAAAVVCYELARRSPDLAGQATAAQGSGAVSTTRPTNTAAPQSTHDRSGQSLS